MATLLARLLPETEGEALRGVALQTEPFQQRPQRLQMTLPRFSRKTFPDGSTQNYHDLKESRKSLTE
jgi:hypothetical protein